MISTKGLFNSDKSDDYLTITTVKGRNTYPIASREAEQQSTGAAEKCRDRAPVLERPSGKKRVGQRGKDGL